jgi:hypothetical protein
MQDLASMLGGGGAPPGGPPAPDGGGFGPPMGQPAPDDTSQGQDQYATSLDALDGAEAALHAFIQLDPDEGDKAIAATCLQNVLKLKASNQQDTQSGGMKSLQRALQSSGPPGMAG